ncbi:MAG: hypothetical protein A2W93_10485 [Bacteroidetes bacterium GWF2_43_63]|nr:MAG: hypothetical protein A2W94_01985 [Bacteroidetes bacterium GWE2_42_42]OFY52946.1 MAG: hypothetical protein A2W93_10485 [Bacteroidetes bacterium GWF2_43_63]
MCQAQRIDAIYFNDKGVDAYNSGKYNKADSLFKLSAELFPTRDVYVNLALVNNKLGDQCESCKYLYLAGIFGDTTSMKRYNKYCIKIDTLKYENHNYYVVYKRQSCNEEIIFTFFKRLQSGADSCVILVNDSTLTNDIILSKSFEIEKYVDTLIHFSEDIYTITETQPEFPGGVDALMTFLKNNIKYPLAARNNEIQGTVYITYIIEPDGELSNIKVLKGIGGGCDEEAIRVISLMPAWKPGTQRGKPVRAYFNLPIQFILND